MLKLKTRKQKVQAYKLVVSIVFGLFGFLVNFFPFNLAYYDNQTASFMLGLAFPMLITLSWGWKFGLISATVGLGCQNGWLTGFNWHNMLTVPPVTFWIVWHGWMRKKNFRFNRININSYLAEIPFRLVNSLLVYLIYWAHIKSTTQGLGNFMGPRLILLSFVNVMVAKEALNAFVILLITDVLLQIKTMRRTLMLDEHTSQRDATFIVSGAVLFGFVFWFIDAVVDYAFASRGTNSFMDQLAFNITPQKLLVRSLFMLACLFAGLVISRFFFRQQRFNKALKKSEKKYQDLVEHLHEGILILDKNSIISFANHQIAKMFGVAPNEITGRHIFDFLDENGVLYWKEKLISPKTRKNTQHELRFIKSDRTHVYTVVETSLFWDESGNYSGIVVSVMDTTQLKRSQHDLRESYEKLNELNRIVNISPTIVFLLKNEQDWPVEYISDNIKQLGFNPEDFYQGKNNFNRIIHPQDRLKIYEGISNLTQDKTEDLVQELRFFNADGQVGWIEIRVWTRRTPQGHITHFQGIATVISERKFAEEKSTHLNAVLDAIRKVDQLICRENNRQKLIEGICTHLVYSRGYNSAWIALFKENGHLQTTAQAGMDENFPSLATKLINGQSINCIRLAAMTDSVVTISDHPQQCTDCPLACLYTEKGSMAVRLEHDGYVFGIITVSLSLEQITDTEEQNLFKELSADISLALHSMNLKEQRLRSEQALLKAKELAEQASETKNQFLANISHEIRTPLNAILGFSDMMRNTTQLDSIQTDYLETISKSGQLLLSLIDDILDISMIESGRIQLDEVDFYLTEVVENTIRMIRPALHAKPIEFKYFIDPSIPQFYTGDPKRLRQIIINLLNNAIKFTDQGSVSLSIIPEGRPNPNADTQKLIFTIQDTGIGICPSKQEIIFAAFSQADASLTRQYGGSGLGLTICKNLINKMGGSIGLESEQGKGSKFVFKLQLQKADFVDEQPTPQTDQSLNAMLVGGNKDSHEHLAFVCTQTGISIKNKFSTADDVLKHLVSEDICPDIIFIESGITDMPVTDLCAQLQKVSPESIPTILTADMGNITDQSFAARFLLKPVIKSEMFSLIQDIIPNQTSTPTQPLQTAFETKQEKLDTSAIQNKQILIAEDNEANMVLIKALLKSFGCKTTPVSTGLEAFEMVKSNAKQFDAILMDIHMPELNGIEATARIRSELNLSTPIIALSADAMKADQEKAIQAGMDDYLTKPINKKLLVEKLSKWTNRSSTLEKTPDPI